MNLANEPSAAGLAQSAADVHAARRARVLDHLSHTAGVAVIATAPSALRNQDAEYPYRHDSSFYYLSGFAEPEAWLVLDGTTRESTLFCRDKNVEREIWEGFRFGPDAARDAFGFSAAYSIDELDARMPDILAHAGSVHYALGSSAELDARVRRWLDAVRAKARVGVVAPANAWDLRVFVDEMRVHKDDHELAIMRRAARISAAAHRRAMQASRAGIREYELEAELLYEFRRQGAQSPAYGSIVASGANACVLHYPAGDTIARDGDLILIDAACELDGYASDITRTFPANGRFTGPQRELYAIVLAAQQAAIDATRAGASYDAPHDAAVRVLAQGMLDTKLLDRDDVGQLDDVIEKKAYRRFYMHSTSHWIGMDVHDVGDYFEPPATGPQHAGAVLAQGGDVARPRRTLVPRMALTIEPGLYVRAADDVPAAFHGIGIRIEDDAVVTPDGCELLTRDVPVEIDAIEHLMKR
ncbi:aminopeptidase P N-terminal domain-containing protein [Pararobbsia silviterrae]|uniref:Xaa-Pro aminopeptidase n=1 Tax=Pararobbsia silviterrae TaxID=1792498 RepID=A0A494Y9W0_9BURK|nr:aminopeptidase P N-terminal domain-containing protein [Pararobbsia silviterrae]RKP59399.1 M24 family metallopeptidase [Pararobbsia silviterrae]